MEKEVKRCCSDCKKCHPFMLMFDLKSQDYLKKNTIVHNFKKSDYLFQINEKASSLWLIDNGKVKISNDDINGNEKIISIFQTNEVIWESLFIKDGKYSFNCICLEDSKICQIDISHFEKVIDNNDIAIKIISLLSKKLHDANTRNKIISKQDPIARICGLFLYISNKNNSDVVTLKGEDIASSVILTTETVSRKLQIMIEMKMIKKIGQSSYKIIDYDKLVEISDL